MKQSLVCRPPDFRIGCGRGAPRSPLVARKFPGRLGQSFQSAKEDMRLQIQGVSTQVDASTSPAAFQLQT